MAPDIGVSIHQRVVSKSKIYCGDSGGNSRLRPDGGQIPFRYKGYLWIPSTGFYYLNARFYDPTTGRFVSEDPQGITPGDAGSFNAYAYADNNPVTMSDPTGGMCETDAYGLGGLGAGGGGVPDITALEDLAKDVETFVEEELSAVTGEATSPQSTALALPETSAIQPYYPPNNGFEGEPEQGTLAPGDLIGRRGPGTGKFAAPAGTPPYQLSLPPSTLGECRRLGSTRQTGAGSLGVNESKRQTHKASAERRAP